MIRASQIKSFTCLGVTFFLLASIISSSFASINQSRKTGQYCFAQKVDGSAPANAQLPFEEKERETDNSEEFQKSIDLIFWDLGLPVLSVHSPYLLYTAPRSCGNATDIPIYLAIKTLLI